MEIFLVFLVFFALWVSIHFVSSAGGIMTSFDTFVLYFTLGAVISIIIFGR